MNSYPYISNPKGGILINTAGWRILVSLAPSDEKQMQYYDRVEYDISSKPKLFKKFAVPLFPYNVENVEIWLHRKSHDNVHENLALAIVCST